MTQISCRNGSDFKIFYTFPWSKPTNSFDHKKFIESSQEKQRTITTHARYVYLT